MIYSYWVTVAILWLVAVLSSILLTALHMARQKKVYWLLPHPGTMRGMTQLALALSRQAPFLFAALFVIPMLAIGATILLTLHRV
jgi:hypothetical protein